MQEALGPAGGGGLFRPRWATLLAFWRMDEFSAMGGRVIAWGDESFTVKGCGLEGGREFALVFDLRQGRVARLLVIEDLSFIPGWDFPAASVPAVLAGGPATTRSPGRCTNRCFRVVGSACCGGC